MGAESSSAQDPRVEVVIDDISALDAYNMVNHPYTASLFVDLRPETQSCSIDMAMFGVGGVANVDGGLRLMHSEEHLIVIMSAGGSEQAFATLLRGVRKLNAILRENPLRGKNTIKRISKLRGGFEAFRIQYPFMCTDHALYQEGRLFPSHVDENVFISNYGIATDAHVYECLGLTHVVNCTPDVPFVEGVPGLVTMRIPVADTADYDITQYTPQSNKFITDAVDHGHRVLVHCKHGKSRSVSVVAAWMMSRYSISAAEAFARISARRPVASPLQAFVDQLTAVEQRELLPTSSP